MGKQYKKLIKRRRRTAYLARRKAAATAANPSTPKKAKAPAKKATRKKAAAVEKAEPLQRKQKQKMSWVPMLRLKSNRKKSKQARHRKIQRSRQHMFTCKRLLPVILLTLLIFECNRCVLIADNSVRVRVQYHPEEDFYDCLSFLPVKNLLEIK